MKNKQIIITAVVFIMLISIGVKAVLADGPTPVGIPLGKTAVGQTAPAIVTGPPIGIRALSAGDEFVNSSHLSKPQSQPATELMIPNNP